MTTFEDKLHASAQRLATQENKRLSVPQNPLSQKKSYWGWVATPAAAIVGIVFGMSMHLLMDNKPNEQCAHQTDTIHIFHPVHDTLYLTQVVEKEKIIVRQAANAKKSPTIPTLEDTDTPQCTSVQCDGINYAILALN